MVVRILSSKPPLLRNCIPSLYSCDVIGILIKLILLRSAVLLNDHDNGVETTIFSFRYMPVLHQVLDPILTLLQLTLYTSLCACKATLSNSNFCILQSNSVSSSFNRASAASFSSIACLCSSFILSSTSAEYVETSRCSSAS